MYHKNYIAMLIISYSDSS